MFETHFSDQVELLRRLKETYENRTQKPKEEDLNVFLAFCESLLSGLKTSFFEIYSLEESNILIYKAWDLASSRQQGDNLVEVLQSENEQYTTFVCVNTDVPFLVDSLEGQLSALHIEVESLSHPVLKLQREEETGKIEAIDQGEGESFIFITTSGVSKTQAEEFSEALRATLSDVHAAVNDWSAMRDVLQQVAQEVETEKTDPQFQEGAEFLRWLDQDNFVLLGTRSFKFIKHTQKEAPLTGLGILRDGSRKVFSGLRYIDDLPTEVQKRLLDPKHLVRVTKGNIIARVHRWVPLDTVSIKRYDSKGTVIGEHLFVGLFTSKPYNRSVENIPLLRNKVTYCLEKAGFSRTSHGGKAWAHILENYPRDELFQISAEELFETVKGIVEYGNRPLASLFLRKDELGRFISVLLYVPRDQYTTRLRRTLLSYLGESFKAEYSSLQVSLTESSHARVHAIYEIDPNKELDLDSQKLEKEIQRLAQSWSDRVSAFWVSSKDQEIKKKMDWEGLNRLQVAEQLDRIFPVDYQYSVRPEHVLSDLDLAVQARHNKYAVRLSQAEEGFLNVRLFVKGAPAVLADVLPLLENMGLKVYREQPYRLRFPSDKGPLLGGQNDPQGNETAENVIDENVIDENEVWFHDIYGKTISDSFDEESEAITLFRDAFIDLLEQRSENDPFNQLILLAGLNARQVMILRAFSRYLGQAGIRFSQAYLAQTLSKWSHLAVLLIERFEARFDPALDEKTGAKKAEQALHALNEGLKEVSSLDEDRMIQRFLNLIDHCLRTNAYQRTPEDHLKDYISFKFESQKITDLPFPRPLCEIWVYSPHVEGVHLRGGKVARGGLRWSDRREDFRTEVLGLVKAQMTKNSVIVPVGSKGGFFAKSIPETADRQATRALGIEAYQTFIRGLLDLTDNRVRSEIITPKALRCYDEKDPYLVVAADKGTATFSDIANAISQDYGFWLGDAFASGGSEGYDHKKMGITARGAWESVKRHFRETGRDTQTMPFSVVGVGDMSGDVFGNGMLLSKEIELVAAFNHLHIFVDPKPENNAATWEERRRLFDLPRSSWADYDQSLLSKGGAVFDRSAKELTLSPEIQARFGLEKENVTPNDLIQVLLTAKVDLLWFGGIGTYICAEEETPESIGDRANDEIRITGSQVKAAVVGEGANLGCTQLGRIEYARAGGRINTDALDNSAGVETSDHEVNIKILLQEIAQEGTLSWEQRNELLQEMTDEVAALVLRTNYLQSQCLSVTQAIGPSANRRNMRVLIDLEERGLLNRDLEFLPEDETLETRRTKGEKLFVRPELSVLMAYVKNDIQARLLQTTAPEKPCFDPLVRGYFPMPLQERYGERLLSHSLRRELVATRVSNQMINRGGLAFVFDLEEKTGRDVGQISQAFLEAVRLFDFTRLWKDLEGYDLKISCEEQVKFLMQIGRALRYGTSWFLFNSAYLEGQEREALQVGFELLSTQVEGFLSQEQQQKYQADKEQGLRLGLEEDLATRLAALPFLLVSPDILRFATEQGRSEQIVSLARFYFDAGARFRLGWLQREALQMVAPDHWHKQAQEALAEDLQRLQLRLVRRALKDCPSPEDRELDSWLEDDGLGAQRLIQRLDRLYEKKQPLNLATLTVLSRQFQQLVDI